MLYASPSPSQKLHLTKNALLHPALSSSPSLLYKLTFSNALVLSTTFDLSSCSADEIPVTTDIWLEVCT